jgi:hypothetical protein
VIAALEIELVGGQGFWAGLAAPALIAVAAVAAAIVAARTANRRQQAQLGHDLQVRRDEHVRDALDFAVEQVHDILSAVNRAELDVLELEETRPKLEATLNSSTASEADKNQAQKGLLELGIAVAEHAQRAHEASLEMIASSIRLNLRLGEDCAVADAHEALSDAWEKQLEALAKGHHENRSKSDLMAYETLDKNATEAYSNFYAACRSWLNRQ